MTEFELIRTYFASQAVFRPDVRVGIGDDAAFVQAPAGTETVITTDVLVAGIHFFEDVDPAALGYKSLAVNLSDLAASGADPCWFLLNLTLPHADADWLRAFASGVLELAQRYRVQLIGGDTSRGPLAIGITAIGVVPQGRGLLRSGAQPGDQIYVTGTLGDAALALDVRREKIQLDAAERFAVMKRLERPTPRVAEGLVLRDIASSAIDVSDGLLADLGHILEASGVGARLSLESLPLSAVYREQLKDVGWNYALTGGDDYELCFTVAPANVPTLTAQRFESTRIGEVVAGTGLDIRDATGKTYEPPKRGFEHFSG